jgi:hypothetical protein
MDGARRGAVGRIIKLGKLPVNLQIGAYYNIRPMQIALGRGSAGWRALTDPQRSALNWQRVAG